MSARRLSSRRTICFSLTMTNRLSLVWWSAYGLLPEAHVARELPFRMETPAPTTPCTFGIPKDLEHPGLGHLADDGSNGPLN